MNDQTQGRRVTTPDRPPVHKLPIVIVLVLLLLAGGYGAACYFGSAGTLPPSTTINGLEVGGMTQEAALALLNQQTATYPDLTLSVSDSDATYTLSGAVAAPDYAATLAEHAGGTGGFLTQGVPFLANLFSSKDLQADAAFTAEGEAQTDQLLATITEEMGGGVKECSWEIQGETLVLTLGTPGRAFDMAQVKPAILATLSAAAPDGIATLVLESSDTQPQPPDLAAIQAAVNSEAVDATLDSETYEILPSTTGVTCDLSHAADALEGAAAGSQVTFQVTLTPPAVTTEDLEALLFRDVLGEVSTYVSGSSNRASNTALGAKSCNDIIILPGEVFSFNDTTGSRNTANGYLPAPAYINGQSVDDIGGGICQVSSSIYYAALKSNLKIVERSPHMYAVGYVPDGTDATVYFGSLDFRFENDTKYPIKIVTSCENRSLLVQIMGTKLDDVVVQIYTRQLSYTPFATVYQIDENLAAGSSVVDVTPYNGRKVESYRELYKGSVDKENLISSTLESVSNYKSRDKIIRISPADVALYGLNADGTPIPEGTETPAPVETPAVTETPAPAETPAVTETPAPAETPAVTETPAPAETPAVVETTAPETPVPTPPSALPEGIPT